MPAPPELRYDTIYHIWNRGVNHSTVFRSDENYRYFLGLYVQHIEPVARTYAYCLLPNHFHFLIRTRTEEEQRAYRQPTQIGLAHCLPPSQGFSNLFNAYVRAYNKRYQRTGGLFEDRFGRKPVDTDAYLTRLVVYIHQNPVRHGLVKQPAEWAYSSYEALSTGRASRVCRDVVMSWFGNANNFEMAHREIVQTSEVSEDL
jgi:REP element-mobilizing transposase RayT